VLSQKLPLASTNAISSVRGQCRRPLSGSCEGLALPCSHAIGSSFLTANGRARRPSARPE
jgi:hypothetical protein